MNYFTDKKNFEKLSFSPFSTKDLRLDEDIDLDRKLFNDEKKKLKIRYYSLYSRRIIKIWQKLLPRQLFNFSSKYQKYEQKF